MTGLRVVAIVAVYNEQRFIGPAIRHLTDQGVDSYVIDNESTDGTREILEALMGRGVIGIETFPRRGTFELGALLRRKEELHHELGADWYLHQDADEFHEAPFPHATLVEGIAAADRAGYNAIDFDEFVFMPTHENPDFEHGRFLEEMRHYFHLAPTRPWRINAWKNTGQDVDLTSSGGHQLDFDGRRLYPRRFVLRHYIALSARHAEEKYCARRYDAEEIQRGWHGRRATLRPDEIHLPRQAHLTELGPDQDWDTSNPLRMEPLFLLAQPPGGCRQGS